MHSSGRGEESPDAYRGVVHPTGQNQQPLAYGEQVQPAGGTPWGPISGAGSAPEPADATQMMPPYPGDAPVQQGVGPGTGIPVADATQMLPPYPGGAPGAQEPGGSGAVPPLPPVPPQPPHHAQQPAPNEQHGIPPVAAAEATQAMPLSIFPDDQQYPQQGYEQPAQQGYGRQQYEQGYEQQQYGGPQHGGGQDYGYEQQSGPTPDPQHDSDYDHLFRTDVPSPPQIRQHIIAKPSQQQGAQQPYGQQAAAPYDSGYDSGYGSGPGYDDGDRGRGGSGRMSPKVLIGIVVAGIVVTGLVVGSLLSGGGGGGSDAAASGSTGSTAPSTSAAASGAPGAGDDAAAKQQAQELDALLKTSGNSRSAVVSAVASVKDCKDMADASAKLRSAATQRTGLVTQLGQLSVDQLPGHAELTDALTKAWQASGAADTHYASWSDQVGSQDKLCKGGKAHRTPEMDAGDRESSTATQQKKRAVKLWNTIAEKYGLTTRQYSQL